jgi:hypothetical protein
MCDALATSAEHVPPKCLFPKRERYRRHLITVPSCDAHNSGKSKSDELLRWILASAISTNDLARRIFKTGSLRSFERRPHIMQTFMPNLRELRIGTMETGGYTVDLTRFSEGIASVVRGLHFNQYRRKLRADMDVVWAALRSKDFSIAPYESAVSRAEGSLQESYQGVTPEVFQYSFSVSPTGGRHLCRLKFYEGIPIYVFWHPEPDKE